LEFKAEVLVVRVVVDLAYYAFRGETPAGAPALPGETPLAKRDGFTTLLVTLAPVIPPFAAAACFWLFD
jgi:hypothetical protein